MSQAFLDRRVKEFVAQDSFCLSLKVDGPAESGLNFGMTDEKATRRSPHRTQWTAQFAVASELCKRGYEVALTMGNHPNVDIMAISPNERPFGVDVKGLYKKNYWPVHAKVEKPGLFYVLRFVPDSSANRFFIMTQKEVNEGISIDRERAVESARMKGHSEDKLKVFLTWPGYSRSNSKTSGGRSLANLSFLIGA